MDYLLSVPAGSTSVKLPVYIQDSAAGDGAGLTGLVFNSSALVCYYYRQDAGNVGGTVVSLQTATLGTWASGGFKEKDSTNLPGVYEFGIPDAALATGASWVMVMFSGFAGMVQKTIMIQLTPQPAFAKNKALAGFAFVMYNSSGTPTTGLTVSGAKSLNGGAFAGLTNSVTEIANGWYTVDLAAGDVNGNTVGLKFSATGAVDTEYTLVMQAVTP